MKKTALFSAVCAALLTLSSVSCGSYTSDNSYMKEDAVSPAASYSGDFGGYADYDYALEEAEMPMEPGAPAPDPSSGASKQNDLSSRKIIRTANLSFETTGYDAFLGALNTCIAENGGYVESSETYGGGVYSSYYNRNAYITARVPADRYDAFMTKVTDLGALTHRSESKDDVTMSYVDIESHIRALETEYDTLIEILDKAESLEDVILLQNRISEVNYELDSYKSQIRKYDDLISYCTVHISVNEVQRERTPNETTQTFGERIITGLRENLFDIGEDASDFAVWFVTSLPYLLIWAVIIVAVILIIRALVRGVKKKKEKKLIETYLRSQDSSTPEKKDETADNS